MRPRQTRSAGAGNSRPNPSFRADLQESLNPRVAWGDNTPTFTRATTATVEDYLGRPLPVLAGEARFKGARRVRNLITASEDMTNGVYTFGANATATATVATFDGTADGRVNQTVTIVDDGSGAGGRTFVLSAEIALLTGTISSDAALQIRTTGDAVVGVITNIGNQVTTTPKRFSVADSTDAAGTGVSVQVLWDDAGTLSITNWQLEETTGNDDTTIPSEYVSSGVGTGVDIAINGSLAGGSETGWSEVGVTQTTATSDLPTGNTSGYKLVATADDGTSDRTEYAVSGLVVGKDYVITAFAKRGSQGTNQRFSSSTFGTIGTISITSTSWKPYIIPVTATATSGAMRVYAANTGSAGDIVEITDVSIKEADHGANRDGVQWFKYKTANSVASGVVTEAQGVAITETGAEITTNGGFDSDSNWTKGSGWTVAGGVATCDGVTAGSTNLVNDSEEIVLGRTYRCTFTVSNYTGGAARFVLGGNTAGTDRTSNGTFTEDILVTAASNATVLIQNKSGGSLGADIDNVSVKQVHFHADADGPEGYLSEGARTNVLVQSNAFTTTWTDVNATPAANYATAPDGSKTGWRLIDDGATGAGSVYLQQALTITTNVDYAWSVYAKADQLSWLLINLSGYDESPFASFDLSGGTVGTVGAGISDSGIESVGNGWYRCWVVYQSTTDVVGFLRLYVGDADNDATVDLDGTSSILVRGAQVEAGSFPSTYIPTTTTAVTRNADDESYSAVGNADSFPMTVSLEVTPTAAPTVDSVLFSSNDGTADQRVVIFMEADDTFRAYVETGVAQANVTSSTTVTAGTTYKITAVFAENDVELYVDGVSEGTPDTTATMPSGVDTISVGASYVPSNQANASIRNVKIYPRRLNDSQVAAL